MQVNNHTKNGRVWAGLFLLGIGGVLLLKQLGIFFPYWLFSWPVILIGLGLFIGLKHGFRGPAWIILIAIGSIFLADIIVPDFKLKRYALPIGFIAFGLMMLFRPKRFQPGVEWKKKWEERHSDSEKYEEASIASETTNEKDFRSENYLDSVAIFGGVRKVIVSKNFKGGDLVAIFGGNEIDLSQADITSPVVIDFVQIMGGSKLFVPAHWEVRSEMVAIFGGIEDKRKSSATITDPSKVLILKGTSIFAGIDIKTLRPNPTN
jgi:predicted membrane protein